MTNGTNTWNRRRLACSVLLWLSLATPVSADRAVPSNYFQRLRVRKRAPRAPPPASDGASAAAAAAARARRRTSALFRSFVLAGLFWAARFAAPCFLRGLRRLRRAASSRLRPARDSRGGRSRRRGRNEPTGTATSLASGTTMSMSPSVLEILELADDGEDDDSSLASAGSSLVSSAASAFLGSVRSFRSGASRSERASRSQASSSRARRPASYRALRRAIVDEEDRSAADNPARPRSLPRRLHHIDEGDDSDDGRKEADGEEEEEEWLDDVSNLPNFHGNDGHHRRGRGRERR